jgi:formylglycine-generating enzyme required for sulfatase activity
LDEKNSIGLIPVVNHEKRGSRMKSMKFNIDATATNSTKRFYRAVSGNSGNTNEPPVNPDPHHWVWINPGKFAMGSPTNEVDRQEDEGPQTQVTISKGFWMSKYETTQAEYQSVMGSNPSKFKGDADRPVEGVSWNDASNYCGTLTVRERAAGRLPAGYEYRLPTEAQWEYACRAGTTTATAYGDSLNSAQANFKGNYPYGGAVKGPYLETTTKVGSYAPNGWGLHDMHGNVAEWCSDWYSGSLPGGSVTDPRGPNTGSGRVDRGGGWHNGGWRCRTADRGINWPEDRNFHIGFRPVLATQVSEHSEK